MLPKAALERIVIESNRGAIPGDHGERVDPLGQTKESVFSQPEHALGPRAALGKKRLQQRGRFAFQYPPDYLGAMVRGG